MGLDEDMKGRKKAQKAQKIRSDPLLRLLRFFAASHIFI